MQLERACAHGGSREYGIHVVVDEAFGNKGERPSRLGARDLAVSLLSYLHGPDDDVAAEDEASRVIGVPVDRDLERRERRV